MTYEEAVTLLGRKILADKGIEFSRVVDVSFDFNMTTLDYDVDVYYVPNGGGIKMLVTKTYLTGGNGSRHVDEGFGDRFELPPDRAYHETCAAIASFQWSRRLLLATGDPKYADHMERVLYNGFGAAIATGGQRFFYVNPLESQGHHHRSPWFGCACCPPNVARTLASLGGYAYAVSDDALWVNLYIQGSATATELRGSRSSLSV